MKNLMIFQNLSEQNNYQVRPCVSILTDCSNLKYTPENGEELNYNNIFNNLINSEYISYNVIYSGNSIENIEIISITQAIKNYINTGNHDRWYRLNTPVEFYNTISSSTIFSHSEYTSPISKIKFNDETNELYLLPDDINSTNGYILNESNYDEAFIESDFYYVYNNGYVIYYDEENDKFFFRTELIYMVETEDILYGAVGIDPSHPEYFDYIPSILLDYIESYDNNIWDGSLVDVTSYNLKYSNLNFSFDEYSNYYNITDIYINTLESSFGDDEIALCMSCIQNTMYDPETIVIGLTIPNLYAISISGEAET